MRPLDALNGQLRTLPHRIPPSWRALLLAARARLRGPLPDAPELPTLPRTAAPRLLIGPANFAGQATAWARAVEQTRPSSRSVALEVGPGALAFSADVRVPARLAVASRSWGDQQLAWVVENFTHVLAEAGRPLLGRAVGLDPGRELAVLRDAGLGTAVIAHGTDIRLPSRHAQQEPWSPFRERRPDSALRELRARQGLRFFEAFAGPRFVSTPDLVPLLEGAVWCPVVVDPQRWRAAPAEGRETGPLRVVHASSNAWIKGSDLVSGVLTELEQEGLIEYRQLVRVPADEVPAVYRWADVVLDQFRIGSYGVGACEAMATGRVVVGHVAEEVRRRVSDVTGLALPIQEATPADLRDVLLGLRDRVRRASLARRGREFVTAVHDGSMSARVLDGWLSASP